jgi:hypothetical protein
MSGESDRHVRLVEMLIDTVNKRHTPRLGLMLFADHHKFGASRPSRIGGHTPDLYAHDVPVTFRIIGEAKTTNDLDTDRSVRQMAAFFDHLALYPGSSFYLAVPWFAVARAEQVVRAIRRADHAGVSSFILFGP